MQIKKSEALATNILEENLSSKQDQIGFEQTISESRQKMLTLEHLDRINSKVDDHIRSLDELTEREESNDDQSQIISTMMQEENDYEFGYNNKLPNDKSDGNKIDINKISGKSDQMFFEFFGMYTKESIKVQKRTEAKQRLFNTR